MLWKILVIFSITQVLAMPQFDQDIILAELSRVLDETKTTTTAQPVTTSPYVIIHTAVALADEPRRHDIPSNYKALSNVDADKIIFFGMDNEGHHFSQINFPESPSNDTSENKEKITTIFYDNTVCCVDQENSKCDDKNGTQKCTNIFQLTCGESCDEIRTESPNTNTDSEPSKPESEINNNRTNDASETPRKNAECNIDEEFIDGVCLPIKIKCPDGTIPEDDVCVVQSKKSLCSSTRRGRCGCNFGEFRYKRKCAMCPLNQIYTNGYCVECTWPKIKVGNRCTCQENYFEMGSKCVPNVNFFPSAGNHTVSSITIKKPVVIVATTTNKRKN